MSMFDKVGGNKQPDFNPLNGSNNKPSNTQQNQLSGDLAQLLSGRANGDIKLPKRLEDLRKNGAQTQQAFNNALGGPRNSLFEPRNKG